MLKTTQAHVIDARGCSMWIGWKGTLELSDSNGSSVEITLTDEQFEELRQKLNDKRLEQLKKLVDEEKMEEYKEEIEKLNA